MAKRKTSFVNNEFYHIYNRGVDKRKIFSDQSDLRRFLLSVEQFNCTEPIGSIYEETRIKTFRSEASKSTEKNKLVNLICFCLNENHYHLLLEQVVEFGIEKFMQRLGTGYTKYFNAKYKRNGSLFQGIFQSVHVDSNEYLLHLSAYINLNNRAHVGSEASKTLSISSWNEFVAKNKALPICKKEIVLDQFSSFEEYKIFAEDALRDIVKRKEMLREQG